MNPDILTTAQAARIWGVCTRTAQLWIESGAVASWKTPGGHRRVRAADVLGLLAQGQPAVFAPTSAATSAAAPAAAAAGDGLPYPVDAREGARLAAVARCGLVDSVAEDDFDDLARLAAQLMDTPIALITLLTPERQWFKSHHGLAMAQTPRSWAFCNYTVLQQGVFQVRNLAKDARFAANPAVQGDPFFRFYAGAPLRDGDGHALGSLCVIDRQPRRLDARQCATLSILAVQVSAQIQLRIQARELHRLEQLTRGA